MQDEQHLERTDERGIGLVVRLGHLEHHREEVLREAKVVVGIYIGKALAVSVRPSGNRRHLRDQPDRLLQTDLGIGDLRGLRIHRPKRSDDADEHPHWMRVVAEPLHQTLEVLVQERVVGDVVCEPGKRVAGRQLTVKQEIRGLQVRALERQLLDRVAAVPENPCVAVDERHGASDRRSVQERRVVAHQSEVVVVDLQLPECLRADRPILDRHLDRLTGAVVGDRDGVGHRTGPPRKRGIVIASALGGATASGSDTIRAAEKYGRRWSVSTLHAAGHLPVP